MEINFTLKALRLVDEGAAIATVQAHLGDAFTSDDATASAWVELRFFIPPPPVAGTGAAPGNLQAIGDAALQQARALLHPANLEATFRQRVLEAQQAAIQSQTDGLMPGM